MQSKKGSITEACINVFSGMLIAFTISQLAHTYEGEIQKYIWKGFEWNVTAASSAMMTIVFTMVSVVRGYAWRRFFNKLGEHV